jgi:hypothetical protein
MKDLVALVADKNMEWSLRSLIDRHVALGTRALACDPYVHPGRDPGCLLHAHDFLRPLCRAYAHALVMFDREGCGGEHHTREQLEQQVGQRLSQCGWDDRAAAVVLDPELEVWIWGDLRKVEATIGWHGNRGRVDDWLRNHGLLPAGQQKPDRPKEAFERVLRTLPRPRSSSIYGELAQTVSLDACIDPAFGRLRALLRNWFGQSAAEAIPSG